MHELSIVEVLIEQVEKEVEQAGEAGRVSQVDLVIGRLSGVNTDSIRFAFEVLAPGTLVEGAELRIAEPQALCCCRTCGVETEVEDLAAFCPRCDSSDIYFEGGQELLLEAINLET